ncbi:MAG: hypothetical protein N2202_00985 [Proteobacteria bacterium]|nr:hypothetical protein [Pseudomonadota bacterium]
MKFLKEKELWLILFVLGVIILNYPLITIFNQLIFIAGYPLFFIYLNLGWIISIFVIYLYSRGID